MKTIKQLILFTLSLLFAISNSVNAQTKQFNLYARLDHGMVLCLANQGITVSGEWTYHFTYHVDSKTGKVDQIHYNVLHSELYNDVTGEEYFIIDTSTDNSNFIGGMDYMNNIHSNNTDYGIYYDVTDGFMDLAPNPGEGTFVETFKVMTKSGGKFATGSWLIQLHMNADGNITGMIEKSVLDCD